MVTAQVDCAPEGTPRPGFVDARGTTFTAVVRRAEAADGIRYLLDVDGVLAGDLRPESLVVETGPCLPVALEVGNRYLVSTPTPDHLEAGDTLTWEVARAGRWLRLVPQADDLAAYPRPVRAIDHWRAAAKRLVPDRPVTAELPEARRRLDGRWSPIDAAPIAGTDPVAAWTGRELVVVTPDRVAAYKPLEDRWDRLLDPPTRVRPGSDAASVWTGTDLLLWGTEADPAAGLGLWVEPGIWRTLAPPPDGERVGAATWAEDEVIAVLENGATAAYDPRADAWRPLQPLPGPAAPGVWPDGRLVTLGGTVYAAKRPETADTFGSLVRLQPDTGSWDVVAPLPSRGAWSAMVPMDDRLAFTTRPVAPARWLLTTYAPADDAFSSIAVDCAMPDGSATWTGRVILADGQALDPRTGRCFRYAVDPGRLGHAEAWTSRELVRWGGSRAVGAPGTDVGARFVPASPSVAWPDGRRPRAPRLNPASGSIQEGLGLRAMARRLPIYGGIWIDQRSFARAVLALTEPDPEVIAQLRASFPDTGAVTWRLALVRSTFKELAHGLRRAFRVSRELDPAARLYAVGLDEMRNRLEFTYDPADAPRMRRQIERLERRLGVDVAIKAGGPGRDLGGRY